MRAKYHKELEWQRQWARTVPAALPVIERYWRNYRNLEVIKDVTEAADVVVDVGAGVATGLHFLDNRVRVAIDPLMDEYRRIYAYPHDIVTLTAPAERLPLPDNAADAVLCTNCLDHVDDPAAAVGEVARVLRPGGAFVLTVEIEGHKDDIAHPHRFDRGRVLDLVKGFNHCTHWHSPWIGVERYVRGATDPVALEFCLVLRNGKTEDTEAD